MQEQKQTGRRTATGTSILAAAVMAVAVASAARAATYTFIPGASEATKGNTANWTDSNSWVNTASPFGVGTVPGVADIAGSSTGSTAVVNTTVPTVNDVRWANAVAGGTITPAGGSAVTYTGTATLEIDAGGTLTSQSTNGTANGTLLFGRGQPSTATLNMSGGNLNANSSVAITNDTPGTLSIGDISNATAGSTAFFNLSGGVVTLANNYIVGNSSTAATGGGFNRGTGTVTQTGGAITAAGAVIVGSGGQGTYLMSAGSIGQNGTNVDNAPGVGRDAFFVARNANSIGAFTQSGTAAVTIANGLYIANNSTTTGTYTVNGGTLSISGEIKVGASFNSTGTVAATNNVGALVLNGKTTNGGGPITANRLTADTSNSTLGFGIDTSAGATLLNLVAGNITNTAVVASTGNAVLSASTKIDVDNISGYTPAATATFELIRAAGGINALPTLVNDGDAFDSTNGWSLSIVSNYLGNGGQSLVLSQAVPEPTTLAGLAAGGLILARRRRRHA